MHYCDGTATLELPDSCHIKVYESPEDRVRPLGRDHWLNAGKLPQALADFLANEDDLLVIVNDQYRPTPTAKILAAIRDHLSVDRTEFLVATALHDAPTNAELRAIFGGLYDSVHERIHVHSAFDESGLRSFGSGERSVRLNALLERHRRILTIGSVEPHYFAGFTGGRKIILPGCASFDNTRQNHALAVSDGSRPLATEGNPVWTDIRTRTTWLDEKQQFSIQVVTGHAHTLLHAAVGEWDEAFANAAGFVTGNFAHSVDQPYDIVVSVVYPPLDRNLYQLQKSYENVASAVKDGGTVLLVSCCSDGAGDERFLKLAEAQSKGEKLESSNPETTAMGIHKVVRTAALAERLNLMLVSELPADTLQYLPITPGHSIGEAIDELIKKYGNTCNVAVVLDSASQVLYLKGTVNAATAFTMEENDYA